MKNLRTNKCNCGTEMKTDYMSTKLVHFAHSGKPTNFYGGRVYGFANGICPECDRVYIMYLTQRNGSLAVLDLEPLDDDFEMEQTLAEIEKVAENKEVLDNKDVEENIISLENEEETETEEEFISLEDMNINDLRKMASKLSISNASSYKKVELIEHIENALEGDSDGEDNTEEV